MKNIYLFLFLFISINTFSQSDLKVNLMTGVDYTFTKDFQRDFLFEPEFEYTVPLGASIELSIEKSLPNRSSISTGIGYSKINLYPDLEITFFYGGRLSFEGDTLWVNLPRLKKLELETFSIPIRHKQYFKVGKRLSLYAMAGVEAGFQISQKEKFEDDYSSFGNEVHSTNYSAKKRNLKLFNTVVEIGGGMTYQLCHDFSLVIQANADVADFRRSNSIVTGIWPNTVAYGKWWKDSFLPLGQLSMSLGIQKSFSTK